MALQVNGRLIFGCEEARCLKKTLCVLEQLESFLGVCLVACGERIFRHGYGGECLAEHITALAQRRAVFGHREEHVAVGVEAVALNEVERALCCIEPFLLVLYVVVSIGADEGETSLEPHALGGIYQRTVTVNTCVDAAVLAVETMFHPERHDVVHQVVLILLCPFL